MHQLVTLLLGLSLVQLSQATPLDDFKKEINQAIECPLPPIEATFDEDSEDAQDLKERSPQRFYKKREDEARRHQAFLRKITGDSRIRLDEYGYRLDPDGTKKIKLTAAQWLLKAIDEQNPNRRQYVEWARHGAKPAQAMQKALQHLKMETDIALALTPSQALQNFSKDIDQAVATAQNLNGASIDDIRALKAFAQKYAAR